MDSYGIKVTLDKIICRNTESLHSSDKFALAGAVLTDIDSRGLALPMMRINDGETRTLNQEIFNGSSKITKVGLVLQAWDLDQNDGWVENKDEIIAVSNAIAQGVKLVPKYGTIIGLVLDGVNELVPKVIDQFVEWDNNDRLLQYSAWLDVPADGPYIPVEKHFTIRFKRDDPTGYSDYDYSIEITIHSSYKPDFGNVNPTKKVPPAKQAMSDFRHRADIAKIEGFVGAFPNFFKAQYGINHVAGTIFLRTNAAEWRDVPLDELDTPSLDDFGARMRATHNYAMKNGFVGGFPNFYHASYLNAIDVTGKQVSTIVCGTVLLRKNEAEWRDVPLYELGDPSLDNIGARFRATHEYATKHGFLGGFPNFYHEDYGKGTVCGTILIKPSAGKWRDVLLYRDPS